MMELVTFVLRAKIRKEIMLRLTKPKNQNLLAKEIGTHLPTISRAIKALELRKLVKCLNPEEVHFKLYTLTDIGKFVQEELKKY